MKNIVKDLVRKKLLEYVSNKAEESYIDDIEDAQNFIFKKVNSKSDNFEVSFKESDNNKIFVELGLKERVYSGKEYKELENFLMEITIPLRKKFEITHGPSKEFLNRRDNDETFKKFLRDVSKVSNNPSSWYFFWTDFDGEKSKKLDSQLSDSNIKKDTPVLDRIREKIKKRTNVPFELKYTKDESKKEAKLEILPQLSLDDFKNCKFYWKIPEGEDGLEIMLKNELNIIYDPYFGLEVETVWPQEIGAYIVQLNDDLRQSVKNKFIDDFQKYDIGKNDFQIVLDFIKVCEKNPIIDLYLSDDIKDSTKLYDKIKRYLKKLYPNASISKVRRYAGRYILSLGSTSQMSKRFTKDDERYWSSEDFEIRKRKVFDDFISQSRNIYGDIYQYDFDKFDSLGSPMQVLCRNHNKYFEVIPLEHLRGKKCPHDSESKGETIVRSILDKYKVEYFQYHYLEGCLSTKNNKCYKLTFDFYLPKKNIVIEYDGEQHFRPVDMFGGSKTFERQVILDSIKNKFVEDNNIGIIRIPYTFKKREQIEKILSDRGIL
jgi:very-short-patch-repair endonuclease